MSEAAGRELDIATAKALGCNPRLEQLERNGPMDIWHCGCEGQFHYDYPHGCNEEGMDSDLRSYSTDPACVGEMLEWARERYSLSLVATCPKSSILNCWVAGLTRGVYPPSIHDRSEEAWFGIGASPQEALCRAIVAAKCPQTSDS